ncbi:MAG TPA: FMN-binding glutamate synthase family protein [Chitinophagaceae bacterium]
MLANALVLFLAMNIAASWYWGLGITLPLLALAVFDLSQQKHALKRNYPVVGHLRYLFEKFRPELRQYFFESDLDGKPFNRRQRSIIYQRAKNEKQTVAFGMQYNPQAPGYEWVSHALFPVKTDQRELRVTVGNHQCLQPYSCSILNIAAMSYGALSKTAIISLNEGAALGGFAHNTGEGGISDHHLRGGDLIWQIGTGYFGCRTAEGRFSPLAFRKNALRPEVKMIELKLSQGAKPGHGGILPAAKNTAEIAAIRQVQPGTTVHSPAAHAEFRNEEGLLRFLQLLRELSGGKPVGFKLCIGNKNDFYEICNAIVVTGIIPDFISIDGAEGGTGAAPLEFTDHLGMPLYDALSFVKSTLQDYHLYGKIKVFAAGKIITGFDVLKAISLGAHACYSARGMMMALGCIQALICDSGKCPVGVATQDPSLYNALVPEDKRARVASFHGKTMAATVEIMEACGFSTLEDVHPSRFFRRTSESEARSFEDIYFPRRENRLELELRKLLN